MARVALTANLRRHVECPPAEVEGGSVAACLAAYFHLYPAVRTYVLDDQGAVRKHVAVFVGRELIGDRVTQSDAVGAHDDITIMQALSGG